MTLPPGAIITPKSPVAAIIGSTGVVGGYLLKQLTRHKVDEIEGN